MSEQLLNDPQRIFRELAQPPSAHHSFDEPGYFLFQVSRLLERP